MTPGAMLVALVVVPAVRLLGGRVTSVLRTAAENAAVGGSSRSAHLRGEAVDVGLDSSPQSVGFLRAVGSLQRHVRGTAEHWHWEVDATTLALVGGMVAALVAFQRARSGE